MVNLIVHSNVNNLECLLTIKLSNVKNAPKDVLNVIATVVNNADYLL